MRLTLQIVLFSLLYAVLLYILDQWFNGRILDAMDLLVGRLVSVYLLKKMLIAGVYLFGIILLCIRTVTRYLEYIDQITTSIDAILKPEIPVAEFPQELKDVEITLKDIRYSITHNAQLAREAEQRKNDLVVYLAHDLKTPLTSVIGYLSLLHEGPELPENQRIKYTAIALDKAYRLEQLINEFFDITRFNLQTVALDCTQLDLSVMLLQMAEEFYPAFAEKNLEAQTEIESGLRLTGDADKLARVFDNLLRNVVSYSNPGTPVRISAKQQNGRILVKIRNHCEEIPPEKASRIFDKFFRLDVSRNTHSGGSGLGLSIAKQIVQLHGGAIQLNSTPAFTEFTVTLPVTPEEKAIS